MSDQVDQLKKARDKAEYILDRILKKYSDQSHEIDNLRHILGLCKTLLEEMVQESASGYAKYALHHETLRDDARKVLPAVLTALGEKE